jgi:hypothetical protein
MGGRVTYRDDLRHALERARGPKKKRLRARIKSGWYPGRCKDCPAQAPKGKSRCKECAAARAKAAADLRAERISSGLCSTCGEPAAKLADGTVLRVCQWHREYFAARSAARRSA